MHARRVNKHTNNNNKHVMHASWYQSIVASKQGHDMYMANACCGVVFEIRVDVPVPQKHICLE